jgi:hypothetical protein
MCKLHQAPAIAAAQRFVSSLCSLLAPRQQAAMLLLHLLQC